MWAHQKNGYQWLCVRNKGNFCCILCPSIQLELQYRVLVTGTQANWDGCIAKTEWIFVFPAHALPFLGRCVAS
jgi:hypothetical protein